MKKDKEKEKEEGMFIVILVTLVFGSLIMTSNNDDQSVYSIVENDINYEPQYDEDDTVDFFTVTVTKYNPVREQCDLDPLITADGSFIDTLQLKNGNLKWIAISRDLREHFNYGDTVIIESSDGKIDGEYVVRDTMNPKWTWRVDLLSPPGDSLGKWDNVYIYKK